MLKWYNNFSKILTLFVDIILCLCSSYIAISIRKESFNPINFEFINLLFLYIIPVVIFIIIFLIRRSYSNIIRYSLLDDFIYLGFNILICAFIYLSILIYFKMPSIPRSIGILHPIIFYNLLVIFRYSVVLLYKNSEYKNNIDEIKNKVLIYGAGDAGAKLLSILKSTNDYDIYGLIDDDQRKIGRRIQGYKIYNKNKIRKIISDKNIESIILALPSIGLNNRKKIIEFLIELPVKVLSVPSYSEIVSGKTSLRNLRTLKVEDLINREIKISNDYIDKYKNKRILITGAGGSIGSELCRQIILAKPSHLILIDNSEYNLYLIEMELLDMNNNQNINVHISPLLVSVAQEEEINIIFQKYKPEYVLHAAAYKHVPMLENNVFAAIKNNFFGSINVVNASHKYNVEEFLLVSTDKAVRPTNIMGASKRLSEIYVQSLADKNKNFNTTYSIVRFGNVLNSSGSIVPLFLKQIESGGPITLTHKDVTRFFMTISEAVNLILDSRSSKNSCEVFLLDMGKPIKIYNLARRIIELSGLQVKDDINPDGEIEIKIIGLRPGEKLYEELLIDSHSTSTSNKHIFKAQEKFIHMDEFSKMINSIKTSLENRNATQLISEISHCLPEFNHKK